MSTGFTIDPVRKEAIAVLVASLIEQGHPPEYAQVLATSVIFQTDLDLRNAQLARLLAWLKQEQMDIYPIALEIVEQTREEFERRVQQS